MQVGSSPAFQHTGTSPFSSDSTSCKVLPPTCQSPAQTCLPIVEDSQQNGPQSLQKERVRQQAGIKQNMTLCCCRPAKRKRLRHRNSCRLFPLLKVEPSQRLVALGASKRRVTHAPLAVIETLAEDALGLFAG